MPIMLPNLLVSLLFSVAVAVLYMFRKAYRSRKIIADLRRQRMPMPPFSWVAGHMLAASPFLEKLPPDAVFNYSVAELARAHPEEKMFYLDFWPINDPFLIVLDPQAATELIKSPTAPKPTSVAAALHCLTGGPNLFTMPDDQWKFWRSVFNPAFSPMQMLAQVPALLSTAQIFRGILRKNAESGGLFCLEEATFRLTLDIIGLVILDTSFDYQLSGSEFPTRLRSLVEWTSFGAEVNPFRRWNPVRPLMCWYQGRYVDKFIREELKKAMSRRRSEKINKQESVASMAFDRYQDKLDKAPSPSTNSTFLQYGAAQMRLFLIAGHDTTSSTMAYAFHLLYTHPAALARLRAEHDQVFGPDPAAASTLLATNPSLLNQLPFTAAAIKETLRLFPPGSGIRKGSRDMVLTSSTTGRRFPTENCSVWVVHSAMHRDAGAWRRPDEFVPERWLAEPGDALYPPAGAWWRPFETGPRACLGQTLAMVELKLALVVTAREFDMRPAYDEWYERHPRTGVKDVHGEQAYQVDGGGGGAHTACQYPCRVSKRNQ
ncbi:cytochrome p450 [Diplodia corticola]|uniref:Cytochrome p450 n=1 Tax=Diplodia corticola TaxID=236234 RepID=A0A1J9RP66_9PEZI|nr:cytochrome p450 [Diplodia corticola]OJD29357.1 cytochrome p450 [Diplodia corticola]